MPANVARLDRGAWASLRHPRQSLYGQRIGSRVFSTAIYLRISRNQFHLRDVDSGKESRASAPFTTQRLLVGEFAVGESALKQAFQDLGRSGFFSLGPDVLIQPLEMVEGGLSEVEDRLFRELVIGATRAKRALVFIGSELSDAEVKERLGARSAVR
jgi:hypothetical protein